MKKILCKGKESECVMKKIFKILGVIAILVMIGIGLFIGWIYLSEHLHDKKLDRERINDSTTLSKYVEYHDWKHTKGNLDYSFYAKDIKCDLLKDRTILYSYSEEFGNGYIILDDYTIYKTAFKSDKTYSNGQQCKQIQTDIKFKRFQVQGETLYLISDNNKYYRLDLSQETFKEFTSKEDSYPFPFIENASIKKIKPIYHTDTDKHAYIVLKDDGQIYEQEYQLNYSNIHASKMISETLLYFNKDYGNITDFSCDYVKRFDERVSMITSDKGLFYLKQTDDQKYIDTEQTYEMVASEIYNKYKSDVKYMNTNIIFTTDNNIITTEMICNDIDKEVK